MTCDFLSPSGADNNWGTRPLVMGILNVTPDSFSDGGKFACADCAAERAFEMESEGADIVDIGGESTRPGAVSVDAETELARVLPVVKKLVSGGFRGVISVDTSKALVAAECLAAGAGIINDVSGCADSGMATVLRSFPSCGYVLMHSQGAPKTMQDAPRYEDVLSEVENYLREGLTKLNLAGIKAQRIALDPGFGFGKTWGHNRSLLLGLPALMKMGRPLVFGLSRKSFVGRVTGTAEMDRLGGSLAAETLALWLGALVVRTHAVKEAAQAVKMVEALKDESWKQ